MSSGKLNFKKILNRLILFIGLGVLGHLIFVLSTTDRALLSHLHQISIWHIMAICGLMICPWLGYAARVVIWASFLKEKISFRDAFRVVITSDVASALSPTAIGGAPFKAALLLNRGFLNGNVGFMLTYGIIEDIVFYITGIVVAAFFTNALLINIGGKMIDYIVLNKTIMIFIICILIVYFLLRSKRLIPSLFKLLDYLPIRWREHYTSFKEKLHHGIADMNKNFRLAFRHGKLRMMASITILFLQWMCKFSVLLIILHAFKIDFDMIQIYIRQWVIFVIMLFIPTPGASGGAEASFLLIFGNSIPSAITYLVASLWRLFTYYYVLLSAVLLYVGFSFFSGISDEEAIGKADDINT